MTPNHLDEPDARAPTAPSAPNRGLKHVSGHKSTLLRERFRGSCSVTPNCLDKMNVLVASRASLSTKHNNLQNEDAGRTGIFVFCHQSTDYPNPSETVGYQPLNCGC